MKIFLSHAMRKYTKEEVLAIRKEAIKLLSEYYHHDSGVKFIDNYTHSDAPEDASRLWHLGKSIQQMGEADLVVFCNPFTDADGCEIEKQIVDIYNLNYLTLNLADPELVIDNPILIGMLKKYQKAEESNE